MKDLVAKHMTVASSKDGSYWKDQVLPPRPFPHLGRLPKPCIAESFLEE